MAMYGTSATDSTEFIPKVSQNNPALREYPHREDEFTPVPSEMHNHVAIVNDVKTLVIIRFEGLFYLMWFITLMLLIIAGIVVADVS